jgi:predicted transcriptional regulator
MPKIGRALKSVVELESRTGSADRTRSRPSSPLMNPNRRKVFQYICLHPCSAVEAIVSATGISRSSVLWHLGHLMDSGYAEKFQERRSQVYGPAGFVQPGSVHIFSALAKRDCLRVFGSVLDNPGSDVKLLAERLGLPAGRLRGCMNGLAAAGLVTRVMDGRHARYFPTERYEDLLSELGTRSKHFTRRLMRKLAEEHLRPEIRDMKRENTVIILNIMGKEETLEIPQRNLPMLRVRHVSQIIVQ